MGVAAFGCQLDLADELHTHALVVCALPRDRCHLHLGTRKTRENVAPVAPHQLASRCRSIDGAAFTWRCRMGFEVQRPDLSQEAVVQAALALAHIVDCCAKTHFCRPLPSKSLRTGNSGVTGSPCRRQHHSNQFALGHQGTQWGARGWRNNVSSASSTCCDA